VPSLKQSPGALRSQGVVSLGCDRSLRLLEVSREPLRHETLACDGCSLPYRDRSFDAAICIAVLHHLASPERRYAAVAELVRITRHGEKDSPGGGGLS